MNDRYVLAESSGNLGINCVRLELCDLILGKS